MTLAEAHRAIEAAHAARARLQEAQHSLLTGPAWSRRAADEQAQLAQYELASLEESAHG